jgi:hypothetical protein
MDTKTLRFLAKAYAQWCHPSSRDHGSSTRDTLEANIESLLEEYDEQLIDVLRDMNTKSITLDEALYQIDEVFNWGDRGIQL